MTNFFEIGEIETRSINKGRSNIKVRMVRAAADHIGNEFVIRPAEFTGQEADAWFRACERCGGYGHYSYNQIDGTICYGCFGSGLGAPTNAADAEKLVKARRASRDRKERAERLAAHEQAIAWDAFRETNADVIEWAKGKEERRGFVGDVSAKLARFETLSVRQIEAARRIIEQDGQRSMEKLAAGHFGEIKVRARGVKVTVKMTREIETAFGFSTLIVMETEQGHTLKTFGSGEWANLAKENETYTVDLTVKAHEEYRGEPQTIVTRVAASKAK